MRVDAALAVERLTVRFGGLLALDGLSFAVDPETVHGVIGPNGAGKTTLLNCISGFYRPESGRVLLDGADVAGLRPDRVACAGVARVFQNIELFAGSTVRANVLLGRHRLMSSGLFREVIGWPGARRQERQARDRVEEILQLVGLQDVAGMRVATLPYGTQKVVELARALAMEPSVLLLDEPCAGMNHDEKRALLEAITAIRAATALSVVLVEHDVPLVRATVDTLTVLVGGQHMVTGAPDEVLADPRVIEAYVGAPTHVSRPVRDGNGDDGDHRMTATQSTVRTPLGGERS